MSGLARPAPLAFAFLQNGGALPASSAPATSVSLSSSIPSTTRWRFSGSSSDVFAAGALATALATRSSRRRAAERRGGDRGPTRRRAIGGDVREPDMRKRYVNDEVAGPRVSAPPFGVDTDDGYDAESPTPFPKDEIHCVPVRNFLALLEEEPHDEQALMDCMADISDIHVYNQQWAQWPTKLSDCRMPYKKDLFKVMRGILYYVEHGNMRPIQGDAIDLLKTLMMSGYGPCQVPPGFLCECGAVSSLTRAAEVSGDPALLEMIEHLVYKVPKPMISYVFNSAPSYKSVPELCAALIHDKDMNMLQKKKIVEIVKCMASRAPRWTAMTRVQNSLARARLDNELVHSLRLKLCGMLKRYARTIENEDETEFQESDDFAKLNEQRGFRPKNFMA